MFNIKTLNFLILSLSKRYSSRPYTWSDISLLYTTGDNDLPTYWWKNISHTQPKPYYHHTSPATYC